MLRAAIEVSGWSPEAAVGFAVLARKFKSKVTLAAGKAVIDGKDTVEVLTLRPEKGAEVVLEIAGEDEQKAFDVLLAQLFEVIEEDGGAEERVRKLVLEFKTPVPADSVPQYLTDEDIEQLLREAWAGSLEPALEHVAALSKELGPFRGPPGVDQLPTAPVTFGDGSKRLGPVRGAPGRAGPRRPAQVEEAARVRPAAAAKLRLGKEWRKLVLEAFRLLPRGQGEVLLLNALAGFNVEEIADVLGLAKETVRTRLSRARNKLRNLLKKQQRLKK